MKVSTSKNTKRVHPPFAAHRTSDGRIFARGVQEDPHSTLLEAICNLKARV
ncbi:hypothetical protein Fmac_018526 [Flemingia macrophylla]|uniref:Uncharacterized protein n=1 Tax=Flemingia macrophylla TaxID=520843 RepID=A0ABD1M574_9FABA